MDRAYIITDKFGEPIAVCLDEEVANEFQIWDKIKIKSRPIISSHSALEYIRKSPETPLKRTIEKSETKSKPKRGKQDEKEPPRILEK